MADDWYGQALITPCGDRHIFTEDEWGYVSWINFHAAVRKWLPAAAYARMAQTKADAVEAWRLVLGQSFFPRTVTL